MAVDHVLPFVLMSREWHDGDLHQVWNLVLACYGCNSEKRDCPPAADWMPWLYQRGEHLIASHHPLRETLITQLGLDSTRRRETLRRRHAAAIEMIRSSWKPPKQQRAAKTTQETKIFRLCQSRYLTAGVWAPCGRSSTSRNGGRP